MLGDDLTCPYGLGVLGRGCLRGKIALVLIHSANVLPSRSTTRFLFEKIDTCSFWWLSLQKFLIFFFLDWSLECLYFFFSVGLASSNSVARLEIRSHFLTTLLWLLPDLLLVLLELLEPDLDLTSFELLEDRTIIFLSIELVCGFSLESDSELACFLWDTIYWGLSSNCSSWVITNGERWDRGIFSPVLASQRLFLSSWLPTSLSPQTID